MKLYEIPQALDELVTAYEQALTDSQGEVTPETESIEAAIKAYIGESSEKIEAAACVLKNLEADAVAAKDEAKRLQNRARAFENNADRLKGLVASAVEAIGGKVKTPKFTVYTQKNPPSFTLALEPDADVKKLAADWPEFFKVVIEPRKEQFIAASKEGTAYPQEIAVIANPETKSLRVR